MLLEVTHIEMFRSFYEPENRTMLWVSTPKRRSKPQRPVKISKKSVNKNKGFEVFFFAKWHFVFLIPSFRQQYSRGGCRNRILRWSVLYHLFNAFTAMPGRRGYEWRKRIWGRAKNRWRSNRNASGLTARPLGLHCYNSRGYWGQHQTQ